jgi:heptaprenyl diphosphate synthase
MNVAALLGLPDLDRHLERADEALRASVVAEDAFLNEVGGHLVQAGGKRFRPALAIAAAAAAGSEATDDVVMGGVAVELMHLGSLYHDDVMDDADTRRGVPSANAKWGNLVAILAGDFLLGKASEIATGLGNEVAAVLARTLVHMCEGQVIELQSAFSVLRTEESYLQSIGGKTAALMAAACRIGGLVGDAAPAEVAALTSFGESFGLTFQIYDDIADLVLSEERLGKPVGHDLIEGVYTLPVLHALAEPSCGPRLRELLGGPIEPAAHDEALALIRSSGGVERSLATGRQHAAASAEALSALPPSDVRTALSTIGNGLLDTL